MSKNKPQSLYNFAIVMIGIILTVISYSELTDDGSPEVGCIYPNDFFADTYDYQCRYQDGTEWHPQSNGAGDYHWVRSQGGKIRIAPDGRIMPTTVLSEEDLHKSCTECHENKK